MLKGTLRCLTVSIGLSMLGVAIIAASGGFSADNFILAFGVGTTLGFSGMFSG